MRTRPAQARNGTPLQKVVTTLVPLGGMETSQKEKNIFYLFEVAQVSFCSSVFLHHPSTH